MNGGKKIVGMRKIVGTVILRISIDMCEIYHVYCENEGNVFPSNT